MEQKHCFDKLYVWPSQHLDSEEKPRLEDGSEVGRKREQALVSTVQALHFLNNKIKQETEKADAECSLFLHLCSIGLYLSFIL